MLLSRKSIVFSQWGDQHHIVNLIKCFTIALAQQAYNCECFTLFPLLLGITTVSCPKPAIVNGVVQGSSYLPGNYIRYACNSGYRISGDAFRKCLSSGAWTGIAPKCIGKKLPRLQSQGGNQRVSCGTLIKLVTSFRLLSSIEVYISNPLSLTTII